MPVVTTFLAAIFSHTSSIRKDSPIGKLDAQLCAPQKVGATRATALLNIALPVVKYNENKNKMKAIKIGARKIDSVALHHSVTSINSLPLLPSQAAEAWKGTAQPSDWHSYCTLLSEPESDLHNTSAKAN